MRLSFAVVFYYYRNLGKVFWWNGKKCCKRFQLFLPGNPWRHFFYCFISPSESMQLDKLYGHHEASQVPLTFEYIKVQAGQLVKSPFFRLIYSGPVLRMEQKKVSIGPIIDIVADESLNCKLFAVVLSERVEIVAIREREHRVPCLLNHIQSRAETFEQCRHDSNHCCSGH